MLKLMKMGWNYTADNWRAAAGYIIATCLLIVLYGYKLNTLIPAFSGPEAAARDSSASFGLIVNNPVNAPYKLIQYAAQLLDHHGLIAMRLPSVLFAVGAVWLFYVLVSRLHTPRIALFATTLFATNSWLLHSARIGTPNVLMFALLAIVYCGYFIRYGRNKSRAWLVASLVIGLSLYIPYMVWFVVVGLLWQSKIIRDSYRTLQTPVIAACLTIVALCIIPLVLAMIKNPQLWHDFTGIPRHFITLKDTLVHIAYAPLAFFIRNQYNPVYWLGRLPVLDVFTGVMFIFGVYAYAYKLKLQRTQLLVLIFVVTSVLIGLSQQYTNITIMLPFIYLVITAGIALMLQQWFTVFPRNPIARNIGSGFIIAAILVACSYHITNYFIAWPNNPDTTAAYSIKP